MNLNLLHDNKAISYMLKRKSFLSLLNYYFILCLFLSLIHLQLIFFSNLRFNSLPFLSLLLNSEFNTLLSQHFFFIYLDDF